MDGPKCALFLAQSDFLLFELQKLYVGGNIVKLYVNKSVHYAYKYVVIHYIRVVLIIFSHRKQGTFTTKNQYPSKNPEL